MSRPTAVDLDTVMANLTPEMADDIRRIMPPGAHDQLLAAQDEALALTQASMHATHGVANMGYTPHNDVPEWIRLGVYDTLVQWAEGRARTCIHMPDIRKPQPAHACAWKPGLVVCSLCTPMIGCSGVADKTCDGCGHICEGVDAGDPITAPAIVVGALVYRFGCCNNCLPENFTTDERFDTA